MSCAQLFLSAARFLEDSFGSEEGIRLEMERALKEQTK
jgi:hypothetical protein